MQEYNLGFDETGEIVEIYKPDPKDFENIYCPVYCPRGRDDCESLSQIIAEDHVSFICVGKNNGENRELEQDQYRECFKNGDIDRMEDIDRRDLQHAVAVFSMALAATESTEQPDPAQGEQE